MHLHRVLVFAELDSSAIGEDTPKVSLTTCHDEKFLETDGTKSTRFSTEAEFNTICPKISEHLMPLVNYEAKKLLDKLSYQDLFKTGKSTLWIPPISIRILGPRQLGK